MPAEVPHEELRGEQRAKRWFSRDPESMASEQKPPKSPIDVVFFTEKIVDLLSQFWVFKRFAHV